MMVHARFTICAVLHRHSPNHRFRYGLMTGHEAKALRHNVKATSAI